MIEWVSGILESLQPFYSPLNRRSILIGLLGLVAVLGVSIAIAVIIATSFGVNGPTFDKVKTYCEENGMIIEEDWSQKSSKVSITCRGDGDISELNFVIHEKKIEETQDYIDNYRKQLEIGTDLTEGAVRKNVSDVDDDGARFQVVADRTYLDMRAKSLDAARNCLTRLGYPDDGIWGSDELWQ